LFFQIEPFQCVTADSNKKFVSLFFRAVRWRLQRAASPAAEARRPIRALGDRRAISEHHSRGFWFSQGNVEERRVNISPLHKAPKIENSLSSREI
jgi:hypothetical protein